MKQRIIVIVPVASLEGAKTRLGESLDPEERGDLVSSMLARTLRAAAEARAVTETLVVSPDPHVQALAEAAGARTIAQHSEGLNPGLREARDDAMTRGADVIAVLPIDLPLVSAAAIDELLAPFDLPDRPLVAIVRDRHGSGTNALAVSPPSAVDFAFGIGSCDAHVARAREAGARLEELGGPLAFDVDTPEDLLLAERLFLESGRVR